MTSIEARGISKVYKIYKSPGDRLKEIVLRRPHHAEFVALDNISFSVSKGETFGIIGENGAGKSTLLKIMAKTLKQSSGNLMINGRSAALLELGAGFNPEFTGEENIYLNAYLMGLSKADIEENKARIIDFSELGDFIKRPVKTYSSGMHVRLAFSIAICVNPEILIIDEALSVGDQHFQKKCIDRMMQFKNEGKTIFFCSHSLYLVQELCNRSMWLKNGRMERYGNTSKVINAYNDWVRAKEAGMNSADEALKAAEEKGKEKPAWIEDVKLTDKEGYETTVFESGQPALLRIRIRKTASANLIRGHIGIGINRNDEETVYGVTTKLDGIEPIDFYDGQEFTIKFPSFPLLAGQYYVLVVLADDHALHPYDFYRTKIFSVENLFGDLGIVRLEHSWELGR
jgi:ABC-type polysaccharide/polyol phosphate transport system ATPase subunit